jgi:23S rRNA (adenine1618-N6)-methyltransferase
MMLHEKTTQRRPAKEMAAPVESLHPRNPHRGRYNFRQLVTASPELAAFVLLVHGNESINFSDPAAVKALNRALLIESYGINGWDIPEQYLCPPIPGRADYLHYIADLLAEDCGGVVPVGSSIRVLDIGTGANCIYPLIGHSAYGWQFVGADIDPLALANAQRILDANPGRAIRLRLQKSRQAIFKGIVEAGERFDLAMCNPPFHASLAEAGVGTARKWKNLGVDNKHMLNFGGQGAELWCKGGEEAFVCRMIEESRSVHGLWFTTLISKSATLPFVYRALKKAGVMDGRTIEMAQGQKKSRIVAWTFLDVKQRRAWRAEPNRI